MSNPYPNGQLPITGNTLGASTALGQGLTMWTRNPKTPYSQQWSADVQQQFPGSSLLDIAYIGSHGVHLTSPFEHDFLPDADLNAATFTTSVANPFAGVVSIGALSKPTVTLKQLELPFPQFTSVFDVNNTFGSSTYHSMAVKFVKRASHGVTLLTAFTWSKEIANVNGQDAPIGNTNQTTTPQDYNNLQLERATSDMDVPYNFITSANVDLPFGAGKKFLNHGGFEDKAVGGWSATTIWEEQSGFPLEMSVGSTSWGASRVNRVPGVSPLISGKRNNAARVAEWFNTAAFTTPPAYTYGLERRTTTSVRKPGISNVDLSLVKKTQISDRIGTEFRAEAFNILNSAHFAPPGMVEDGANYGVITGVLTGPPEREIQFALKITF